jgi:hypothetical protein
LSTKKFAKLPTPTDSQKIVQVAALRLFILLQGVSVCLKKSQTTTSTIHKLGRSKVNAQTTINRAQDGFADKSVSLHIRTNILGHSCLSQPLLICLIYDLGGGYSMTSASINTSETDSKVILMGHEKVKLLCPALVYSKGFF